MSEKLQVDTPDGPGELLLDEAEEPAAVLVLGHGAGRDVDGWDLALLADRLPALGVSVARYRQPYRVAGRKLPGSKPSLDRAWAPALVAVRTAWPGLPLFSGGHSAGSRTACRGLDADQEGLVLLSFPLHQPGRPEKSRLEELVAAGVPVLVVQGTKDVFGTTQEVRAALIGAGRSDVRVVEVPAAEHSLTPTQASTDAEREDRERLVVWAVAGFIEAVLAARWPRSVRADPPRDPAALP